MIRKRNPNRLEPLYDTIVGDGDDETLTGTESRDLIQGLGGADSLLGLGGKDRIEGGSQRDTLVGGKGSDTLLGGPGGDLFRFEAASDSKPGKADVITTFKGRDALDLSAIDADKGTAGNQDFVNVAALTGVAGQLAFSSDGGDGTIVEGDVDGDGVADIRIEIDFDSRDSLQGTDGDDSLIGYDDDETLGGEGGEDILIGGGGNDTIEGGDRFDTIFGGEGNDLIGATVSGLTAYPDSVDGGAGNDTITAARESTVIGGSGDDSITVFDTEGGIVLGSLSGDGGDDIITVKRTGIGFRDYVINGGAGSDTLFGDEGEDTLIGGGAGDTLSGGRLADSFIYQQLADSSPDDYDFITRLQTHDDINLSAIDANALVAGDQSFTRVPDFTGGAGELRLRYDSALDITFIEGDVDGDAIADLAIRARNDRTVFDNFVL